MDEDLALLGELGCPWARIFTSEPLFPPSVEWAHYCEGDVRNTLVGVWFVESATLPCPHHSPPCTNAPGTLTWVCMLRSGLDVSLLSVPPWETAVRVSVLGQVEFLDCLVES